MLAPSARGVVQIILHTLEWGGIKTFIPLGNILPLPPPYYQLITTPPDGSWPTVDNPLLGPVCSARATVIWGSGAPESFPSELSVLLVFLNMNIREPPLYEGFQRVLRPNSPVSCLVNFHNRPGGVAFSTGSIKFGFY